MRWTLTERAGPRVRRSTFADTDRALDALEERGRALAKTAPGEAVNARVRRFEPSERVIARLELSGPERFVPTVRAGLDVRGDGSVEAFTGRLRREMLDPRRGETAYDALRRRLRERA